MTPKRPPTLAKRIEAETGLTIDQLARFLGVSRKLIEKWHAENRVALKIVLSGYKHEVLR